MVVFETHSMLHSSLVSILVHNDGSVAKPRHPDLGQGTKETIVRIEWQDATQIDTDYATSR